jgi:hypothetical protein
MSDVDKWKSFNKIKKIAQLMTNIFSRIYLEALKKKITVLITSSQFQFVQKLVQGFN